ncbi:MAG: hypothetical protein P8186_11265, partial [Anaerolineae bacterium]
MSRSTRFSPWPGGSGERTRPITEAIAAFREAGRIGHTLGDQVFGVTAEFSLATALGSHGQRRAAVAACEQAIERYTGEMGRTLPMTGLLFSWLGLLHYEANQLERARRYAEKGKVLANQLGLGSPQTLPLGILDQSQNAQGERLWTPLCTVLGRDGGPVPGRHSPVFAHRGAGGLWAPAARPRPAARGGTLVGSSRALHTGT